MFPTSSSLTNANALSQSEPPRITPKTQPEGEIFGRQLRELRLERNLTQDALAQLVATSILSGCLSFSGVLRFQYHVVGVLLPGRVRVVARRRNAIDSREVTGGVADGAFVTQQPHQFGSFRAENSSPREL